MVTPDASQTRNRLIRRLALSERLERAAHGPITVVTASAGSGKTMLVRSWLGEGGQARRAAWVSVERGERDAQHFWNTVIAEIARAVPDELSIEAPAPTPLFDAPAVVDRLLAGLAALDSPLVLVIDDLHELLAEEAVGELTRFLDRLPSTVHVVLISRRDPQLGLHRRRLGGELTEIRSADLRFTRDETQEMLQASGLTLSPESLTRLCDRTEGWVAGLRLAAMSLAAHGEPESFVEQFSGSERTVAEYLLSEVLDRQPPEVRRLLTRASLVERVNGPLGDILTGGSGAERVLRELADTGAFVVALDATRTWFRFHHLFSDLLAVELRNTEPEEIPRLHAAIAEYLARQGHVVEAITHARAAGDIDKAAGLLIEHYFSLSLDGRRATARSLLETLPREVVGEAPELATVVAAEELVEGSLDDAEAHLALAERHRAIVPADRRHRLDTALLVTRLSLARRRGDFSTVLDEVPSAAGEREPDSGRDIALDNDARALALMNLGIVEVWSGRFADGERHLEEARDLSRRIGRPYLEVGCQAHLAQVTAWRSLGPARDASREVIALAERHGWGGDPVIGPALVTLATAQLHMGRLDEADAWLARADSTVHAEVEPAVGFLLHLTYSALHHTRGEHEAALARCREAERLETRLVSNLPLLPQLCAATLQALLGLGRVDEVRARLAEISEALRDTGELREVLARMAIHEGDHRAATAALAPTIAGQADVHRVVVLIRSLILEAVARDALGEPSAAEDALERALSLAEPETLILPFIHTPNGGLLERHPRHRTAHGALITSILDALSGRAIEPERRPPQPLGEELSSAERRVLGFLPTNLPAAAIASEIYVSVHTVRTHMRHIYGKLDVHTRAEAVTRARELGLLGG